jgi:hypothetical protein
MFRCVFQASYAIAMPFAGKWRIAENKGKQGQKKDSAPFRMRHSVIVAQPGGTSGTVNSLAASARQFGEKGGLTF